MSDNFIYSYKPFSLSEKFLEKYNAVEPDWGFNGLGKFVYMRTYSRLKENGQNETWQETIKRVVNGVYNMQKKWIMGNRLVWDERKAQRSAQEMYERMFNMKFLPPGRGLWAMGSTITEERGLFAALNNCGFISTETIKDELAEPFCFLMDASMLGVGVGFDTKGSGKIIIQKPKEKETLFVIPDSREGWVESLRLLLNSYFQGTNNVTFDYGEIREEGVPIKGFGGISSGYRPLKELHDSLRSVLDKNIEKPISVRTITDIMNLIGKAVIAGNVRRTAEIVFGDPDDKEFLDLKNYEVNPDRMDYGWTSNNSIFAKVGMDYTDAVERTKLNGEPGYAWLDNMQAFSRMNGEPDFKDRRSMGGNPSLRRGTRVYTTDGIFPIEELENKTFTVNNLYGQKSLAKCFLSGRDKPLIKIVLNGGKEYYATAEHEWPVLNNCGSKQYKKIRTENLTPGMMLPVIRQDTLTQGTEGTYAEGFLIGWNIGDGWQTKRKDNGETQYGFIVSQKDSENSVKERVVEALTSLAWEGDFENKEEINTTRKEVHNLFEKFGVKHKSLGLPSSVWTFASESFRRGLIDGLFSSDGHVSDDRVSLSTAHKALANDVADLLGFYGIKTSVLYRKTDRPIFNRPPKEYESYVVRISGRSNIRHFASIFSLSHNTKQGRIEEITNKRVIQKNIVSFVKIKDVVFDTGLQEDVWDITVYDDTHCFQLSHCITGNCLEQTLESWELCTLVETFPTRHENKEDFLRTLKFAYLYGKSVTLGQTHWPNTNRVMLRNRRIGCSVTGIAQFITKQGIEELRGWLVAGYDTIQYWDEIYSDWFAIPRSIKTTSVKPSGSVSLLAGATPGLHYPESRFYIRRIRVAKNSPLLPPVLEAGFHVEETFGDPSSLVIEFPVDAGEGIRTTKDVSMWEQLALAAFMQKYWADNQVSATITFTKAEEDMLKAALNFYQYQLKGVSFLPKLESGAFAQMPYEEITEEQYNKMVSKIKPILTRDLSLDSIGEKYCSNDSCEI